MQISTAVLSVLVPSGPPLMYGGRKFPVWKYSNKGRSVSLSPVGSYRSSTSGCGAGGRPCSAVMTVMLVPYWMSEVTVTSLNTSSR